MRRYIPCSWGSGCTGILLRLDVGSSLKPESLAYLMNKLVINLVARGKEGQSGIGRKSTIIKQEKAVL